MKNLIKTGLSIITLLGAVCLFSNCGGLGSANEKSSPIFGNHAYKILGMCKELREIRGKYVTIEQFQAKTQGKINDMEQKLRETFTVIDKREIPIVNDSTKMFRIEKAYLADWFFNGLTGGGYYIAMEFSPIASFKMCGARRRTWEEEKRGVPMYQPGAYPSYKVVCYFKYVATNGASIGAEEVYPCPEEYRNSPNIREISKGAIFNNNGKTFSLNVCTNLAAVSLDHIQVIDEEEYCKINGLHYSK